MDLKILSAEIELESTMDRLCDDEAPLLDLLTMLIDEFKQEEAALQEHLQNDSYEFLASKAHHYKGIGANLGLTHFANASRSLEQAARATDKLTCTNELVSMAETIARLEKLMARVSES